MLITSTDDIMMTSSMRTYMRTRIKHQTQTVLTEQSGYEWPVFLKYSWSKSQWVVLRASGNGIYIKYILYTLWLYDIMKSF